MISGSQTPPMAGLRVVDFTSMIAGPYCTRLLADCGAEVIKVEAPGGDFLRKMPPTSDGVSTYFAHLNCGKKSVVLDLQTDEGRREALKLAANADVVVENYRPGVMHKLGLDYATLSCQKPDLVYCSISGFGQTGPKALDAAYAPIVHAASGYDEAQLAYQNELTRPEKCGIFVADILAAVYAFGAVQTALLGQARHGHGQFVDVALMDAMINLLVYECQVAQNPVEQPRLLYTPTATRDGFVIIAPINEKNFQDLAHAVGRPEWLSDPRFKELNDRRQNWDQLTAEIESWTSARSALECEEHLSEAGVPCSQYRTIGDAIADPQSIERGLMMKIDDSTGGFLVPNPPFKFSDGTVAAVPRVATLGQHNGEVLST